MNRHYTKITFLIIIIFCFGSFLNSGFKINSCVLYKNVRESSTIQENIMKKIQPLYLIEDSVNTGYRYLISKGSDSIYINFKHRNEFGVELKQGDGSNTLFLEIRELVVKELGTKNISHKNRYQFHEWYLLLLSEL